MWNLISFVTMGALLLAARWVVKVWDETHPYGPGEAPERLCDPLAPPTAGMPRQHHRRGRVLDR